MKGLFFAVLVLVTATPIFPAERDQGPDTPFYSNEELKKYQYPSERRLRASEPAPPQDNAEVKKVKKITEEVRPTPKRYEVPYKAHEGAARRIIIPVRFNGSVRAPMLLDTGATGLRISVSLAERLGLFGKDEGNLLESTSGIGGTVPAVLTIINKIEVDQLEEQFVPTKVSGSFSKEFEGLVHCQLKTADKEESMEICFVPDNDYGKFLRQANLAQPHRGEILDQLGRVLGHHDGIEFYTIGQRRGLGISSAQPLYVIELDATNNRVVVGDEAALGCAEFSVENCNWIAFEKPPASLEVIAKIRYNHPGAAATVTPLEQGKARLKLHAPARAITPGQAAVFYQDDLVLGGGWMTREL